MPRTSSMLARATGPLAACLLAGALPAAASAQYPQQLVDFGSGIATTGDQTGYSVAILGDVNGDGTDEMIIGAPYDDDNGTDSGTVYVVNGYPGTILYEKHGSSPGNHFGWSVANIGDTDNDGVDDFLVGSPGTDFNGTDTGGITAYSGKSGVSLYSQLGPKPGSQFGYTVAGGGDIDGDGWGDFLVGAPYWDTSASTENKGWAGVYSGHTGAQVKFFNGTNLSSRMGSALAIVGDLDGDDRADYAIGSPGYDYTILFTTYTDAGMIGVYSGADHSSIWTKRGGAGDQLGTSLAGVGDTDHDGQLEVLAGAPGYASGQGEALLCQGPFGDTVQQLLGNNYTTADLFGTTVGALGDVNHDGHVDLLVGAPLDTFTVGLGGYVEAFSGKTYASYSVIASSIGGDSVGSAVSQNAGDLSGDDWTDVLVGWPFNDFAGTSCGLARSYTLTYGQPNLNFQGPGISSLGMYGTQLFPGGVADMGLWYSKPNSPAFLVSSAVELIAPFKDGTLVPNPSLALIVPFVTDAQGKVKLTDIPGGGGPLIVFMQFLIQDNNQPKGWQISNAIAAEFLP